jgi:hypothetical protein
MKQDYTMMHSQKNTKVHSRMSVSSVTALQQPHYALISFIPLACADCNDSLPFSGASSIPLCYIPFPSTIFHQPVFHPPSLHLAINFLIYLSALLFPNSYILLFWEFYFLPFLVHAQTNIIYLTSLSLL